MTNEYHNDNEIDIQEVINHEHYLNDYSKENDGFRIRLHPV